MTVNELAAQGPSVAGASDAPALCASLSAAFEGYPLTEWVVLGDAHRERRRREYFGVFLDHALVHGAVLCTADRSAAAIWYPPGGWNAGPLTLLARLPRFARITGWRNLVSRLTGLARLAGHHPEEPHWYLEVLGTRPELQRRGIGGRLLEAGLERARADGVGAYVITSSEAAIPFYMKHDFVQTDELAIRGVPTCWCLWHGR